MKKGTLKDCIKSSAGSSICSMMKAKVLFVNDGSKDNSLKKIKEICESSDCFTYCSFDHNYGLSAAVKAGFDYSDTPWTGYMDADLQTTPMDFNILLEFTNEYDLITGVRLDRRDLQMKNISSLIANKIRRAFTHDGMDDTGCPLKIIRTDTAKRIPMFNGLHRFLPAMVLLQNGKIRAGTDPSFSENRRQVKLLSLEPFNGAINGLFCLSVDEEKVHQL